MAKAAKLADALACLKSLRPRRDGGDESSPLNSEISDANADADARADDAERERDAKREPRLFCVGPGRGTLVNSWGR